MNFKTKAMALGAVLALTVGATSALASQSSVTAPKASPPKAKTTLGQFGIQGARYVALDSPCRILDTRVHKTPLVQSQQQGFKATGDTASQGGLNCISVPDPIMVSSIVASVSVVAQTTGYARFGKGDAIPLATQINYQGGQAMTTGATIPICTTVNCNHQFSVEAIQGSGDVIVDVAGYFIRPLAGQVEKAGQLDADASSGIISSELTLLGSGHYTLTAPAGFDLSNCATSITPVALGNRMVAIETNEGTPQANTVDVFITQNVAGATFAADTSFHFDIEC